jgi:hypothetical protein
MDAQSFCQRCGLQELLCFHPPKGGFEDPNQFPNWTSLEKRRGRPAALSFPRPNGLRNSDPTPLLRGLCSKMDKDFSIEESIFQLLYSRYDSFAKSKSQAGT